MSALLNSDQQSTYAQRFTGFLHVHISEAWKRFLLAFAGLVLAFAAAVFSRVSRDSGDLWATVILASVALLLATIVGLTTVPYLARRVAVPRVRDAFDYDVTRIGVVYILTALVIGIAALNTGNNLLYIIVAVMLASILISGIASSMTLRAMKLDIHVPEHVFCSRAAMVRIVLQNQYRYFPCFSVVVAPAKLNKARKQWRLEETIFSFPGGRPAGKQWFHLPDRVLRRVAPTATLPPVFRESIYFPLVATSSEASADLAVRFERRGRFRQDSFTLSTGFPFAFLTKKRRVSLQREILVYPSVEPTDALFEVLPLITGEFETFVRGRGYDLYRIRDYMPEDSARHVDWKATAKSGSPKVREFTREDERKLRIVFDNPAPGVLTEKTYESAVALTASLAWHFSHEDTQLSFATQGYSGGADVYRFLAYLALVEPSPNKSMIEELRPSDDYNLILTTRARGTIPTAIWSCSYVLFLEGQA